MKMMFNNLQNLIAVIITIITIIVHHKVHCSVLKTDSIPSKCVVYINHDEVFKEIGDIWTTNDTCVTHSCEVDDHGTPYEKLTKEHCKLDCKNEYEIRPVNGKCCGKCVKTKCMHEGKIFKIGETWKNSDNCTLLECSENNGEAFISTYKKSCPNIPHNCSPEDLYEDNCCLFCRNRHIKKYENSVENNISEDHESYKMHPCKRECISGETPKTCYYKFEVEWYETLSKACYDCPYNLTDCYRPHCIVGDGARRSILVVNRMMPGPSIEVCHNDIIVVDVVNSLLGESTTIHWHGLHQRETPYMDGVPHISQCPIQPHTTFRYTFKADNPGTHFWHSHTGMQRGDGCFGSLIIRQPYLKDKQSNHYDFDLSEHIIMLQDWAHVTGTSMFASHHHSIGSNKPPNILVNGFGRFYNLQYENKTRNLEIYRIEDTKTEEITSMKIESNNQTRIKRSIENFLKFPLERFTIKKGFSYRFRIINAEFLNCPVAISVDNHTLLIINSDGYDLEPVEVASLVTYAGERFDFVLKADQKIGNYWMRFKGLMDCDQRFTSAHQVVIIHYEGAVNEEPVGLKPTYNFKTEGLELNALNKGPGQFDSLVMSELNALDEDNDWIHQEEPDYKFYIYYDFYPKDNPHFHRSNLYGFNQVNNTIDNKLFTPQLNHISLKFPSSPLMPSKDQVDESKFCNSTSLKAKGIDCRKEFCECPHVLQVPLGAVVEMILIDEGVTYDANHPFHLHGNSFRVVGMDRVGKNITVEEIKKMDEMKLLPRKLHKPPIKDTVTVPDGGYTIIRFKADNPGYWLFHCHIEFHAEIGMALVIKAGDRNQMAPVPENFPTCSNYIPKMKIHKNDGNGIAVRKNSVFTFISALLALFFKELNL